MGMRCIVIDDEPLALAQMARCIGKTAFLELAGTFRSAGEAARWLATHQTDLIFADINMPGMNGIDFVRSLKTKPLIVFTTAYSQYALEGFRVDATDYLLKPIGYPDFLRSAEKARHQFLLENGAGNRAEEDRTILVKSEYKVIPVHLKDILYLESRSEYVRIYTETARPLMTLGSLKSYEDKLPEEQFMRIHRSYIVNLGKIAAIERKHIILTGGASLSIGELYEERFRNYFKHDSD